MQALGQALAQASGRLLPATAIILLPVAALDPGAVGERLPGGARLGDAVFVEEVEGAVEAERFLAPYAVGERDVARGVGGGGTFGDEDRLGGVALAVCPRVREEAVGGVGPQQAVERAALVGALGNDQQAAAGLDDALGDAREDAFERLRGEVVEIDLYSSSPLSF